MKYNPVSKYQLYSDEGCAKAKKLGYTGPCIDCPFEKCLEEKDFKFISVKKEMRYRKIKMLHDFGFNKDFIAANMKISLRTIERALKGR